MQRGTTTTNLNNTKNNFAGTSINTKHPCNPNICDFWPHCAHRDSFNNPVMRPTQSYLNQQHCFDGGLKETNRQLEISSHDHHKRKPSRLDANSRSKSNPRSSSGGVFDASEINERHVERRLSPNTRENCTDRKCSPVHPKGAVSRSSSGYGNRSSSSSSSSDIFVTISDRTTLKSPKNSKNSGASSPFEELSFKDKKNREELLTRPGSAPSDNRLSVPESQQRSMSLPKSFLSTSYRKGYVPLIYLL